jgi:methyl-accepting chemotaxis protein
VTRLRRFFFKLFKWPLDSGQKNTVGGDMSDNDQLAQAIQRGLSRGLSDGFSSIGRQLVVAFQGFTDELKGLKTQLTRVEGKLSNMSAELDKLTTDVQHTTDVEESAVTLLQGLSAQIAELKNDPAKLQALSDSLNSEADKLAAAVVANTPAGNGGGSGPSGPV